MPATPTDFGDDARVGSALNVYAATADRRPEAPAIEVHGETLTHGELYDRARRFAGGLADLGLDAGDRLLVYLPNCPEFVVGVFGALVAGVTASPANPQYKHRELGHQLEDAGAVAILTHAALRDRVDETLAGTDHDPTVVTVGESCPDDDVPFESVDGQPPTAEVDGGDVALQPYTSGTTGRPKGVHLTHDNLRAQAFAGLGVGEVEPDEDRALCVLPLYHITGFTHSTWQPLVRGGTVYLRDPADWDAEAAMATIEAESITSFVGVSAMYVDVVNHEAFGEYDLTSLVVANEGGAKLPVAVQRRFESTVAVDMAEGYGLTETTGATHTGDGATFGVRAGTIGQPVRMTDAKVVDDAGTEVPVGEDGEILVRGPQVMAGYHGRPEATQAAFTDDGYFRTGDVGRRDAENYYAVVDRKTHTIVTAGYNVYPSEVEALLYEHDAVAAVAVVGVPDERRGETVAAFVVPAPGAEPSEALADELRQFCLDELAEYKHPRTVEFLAALPRTASGKVQKFKLVTNRERPGADDGDAAGDDDPDAEDQ